MTELDLGALVKAAKGVDMLFIGDLCFNARAIAAFGRLPKRITSKARAVVDELDKVLFLMWPPKGRLRLLHHIGVGGNSFLKVGGLVVAGRARRRERKARIGVFGVERPPRAPRKKRPPIEPDPEEGTT